MNTDNNPMRIEKLKEEAAKQYVKETKEDLPAITNSAVTITNGTEIVILRDSQLRIVAHYQLLEDYKFFRMDKKDK